MNSYPYAPRNTPRHGSNSQVRNHTRPARFLGKPEIQVPVKHADVNIRTYPVYDSVDGTQLIGYVYAPCSETAVQNAKRDFRAQKSPMIGSAYQYR